MFKSRAFTMAEVLAVSAIAVVVSTFVPAALAPGANKGLSGRHETSLATSLYWSDYDSASLLAANGKSDQGQFPADPPVIFLHYDYMADPPLWVYGDFTFSLAPSPEGIELVVDAFRRQGIQLVIDPRHTVLPYSMQLSLGPARGCNDDAYCANFYDLKAQYFHPDGSRAWHYAIFGDNDYLGYAGRAELPGYNFQVTGGPDPELYSNLYGYQCLYHGYDWCLTIQSGLFMHELGHNLNLRHGGFEDQNYKPNYVSVMNYNSQSGIRFSDAPGSTYDVGARLDYSASALQTIDPSHIDEGIGLDGPVASTDMAWYWGCTATPCYPLNSPNGYVPVAAWPVDWNGDGAIEPDIQMELNFFWWGNFFGNSLYVSPPLQGFDDWTEVLQWLNTPAYRTGRVQAGPAVQCEAPLRMFQRFKASPTAP